MYDCKIPFVARASPTIFHRLSQSVKRIMGRRGYTNIVVFQDDFWVTGNTYTECLTVWKELIMLLEKLGFQINNKKLVAPTKKLIFLGILIDTEKCQLSLPNKKLIAIKRCVAEFAQKKRVTKRQMQSLIGRLNFASKVIHGARLFLRRLFNAVSTLKRQHHKIRLQGPMMEDIKWWDSFMSTFNGVAAFICDKSITPVLTDSCLYAGGTFHNGNFFYTVWEADIPESKDLCINYKETLIVALAMQRLAHLCANKVVWLYTDNQCAVASLNKCMSKNEIVMKAMRKMFWLSAQYNVIVKAYYMAGYLQDIPDAISRMHETSSISRMELLLNNWYFCHAHVKNVFKSCSLLNHMSVHALLCILEQVMTWRRVKYRLTRTYVNTNARVC
jgi:hypothetical protein